MITLLRKSDYFRKAVNLKTFEPAGVARRRARRKVAKPFGKTLLGSHFAWRCHFLRQSLDALSCYFLICKPSFLSDIRSFGTRSFGTRWTSRLKVSTCLLQVSFCFCAAGTPPGWQDSRVAWLPHGPGRPRVLSLPATARRTRVGKEKTRVFKRARPARRRYRLPGARAQGSSLELSVEPKRVKRRVCILFLQNSSAEQAVKILICGRKSAESLRSHCVILNIGVGWL